MKKAYILTIDSANPDEDLDGAVRAAVGWMSDYVDFAGEHDLHIHVTDAEGNFVTDHYYEAVPS